MNELWKALSTLAGSLMHWEGDARFWALLFGLGLTTWMIVRNAKLQETSRKQAIVREAIRQADKRLAMGALDLAAALRRREFTCQEVVQLYINQINKVNPILNAVVAFNFEAAMEQAKKADEMIELFAQGKVKDLPPLLGVPCITKEVHEYPGFPYTAGLVGRKGQLGKKKNPALRRIEEAGAIVLACGNTSEACMWSESDNRVHGCSNNPYDITRTPGGSSGGNASMLAALGATFSITSDVGGSTRIPALYNGLFGHKPSGGAIPNSRSLPMVHGLVERYCQLGPCCRSARDLMPILDVIAGPHESHEMDDMSEDEKESHQRQAEFMRRFEWPDPEQVDVRKLRYFVIWEQPGVELGLTSRRHQDMLQAQQRVVETLQTEFGVEVKAVQFDAFSKCFDIWSTMLQTANIDHPFAHIISDGKDVISPFWEALKWIATFGYYSDHTFPALGLAIAESFHHLTPGKNKKMIELGHQLRDELNELLGDDGVLIFPGLPNPAPKHGPFPNLLFFADFAACGIFNTLELPATSVPMGLSQRERLPVGAQIVAANGNDHLTIATALALERVGAAKWVPP